MLDLSRLNPPQRAAVLHGDGPLVVFAGAGSGKTRVITYRIAHLVGERDVPADRILAVTFTNKAAGEMRARIASILSGPTNPWIGTFHSICSRLLRRYAGELGINPQFVIYDDTDQKAMLTRVLRDLDIDERRFPPREMARFIEQQKQKLVKPEEVSVRAAHEEVAQRVYATYEERMQQSGALDFNDLLVRMVYGLRSNEVVRFDLQRKWHYILVDEFQDTNLVQLELVRLLSEKYRNLCVVGDDDQSIYKWRGADRRNILDFQRSFPDAAVVKLEQNYRSSAHILAAAMAVISKNSEREPKNLFTENPPGAKVRLITCADERDEARAITEAVRSLRDHGISLSKMAIFYRTHAQSRVLEEEMRASNLPYRVVGGQRFYERAEVKDVLAYLRVLVNPQDDVSLLRIINTPTRGIGKTTIDKLLDLSAQAGQPVWNTLVDPGTIDGFPKAASSKLAAFVGLIRGLTDKVVSGMGPASVVDAVLEETGYLTLLRAEDNAEADGRIENIEELVASMREFENEAEIATLAQYLELITLQTNADEIDASEKLTLMTVHAAKGLEFPVVWVAGLEERIFPLSREQSLSNADLEEERRLAYVAFTRAEQRLFLSYACARRLHGDMLLGIPSRFLDEIPGEHLELVSRVERHRSYGVQQVQYGRLSTYDEGSSRTEYDEQPKARPRSSDARFQIPDVEVSRPAPSPQQFSRARPQFTRSAPRPAASQRSAPQAAFTGVRGGGSSPERARGESYVDRSDGDGGGGELASGMHVRHAKYGEGEVLSVEAGRPPKVTVRFAGWGVKQILASYLEPG
ncbi:MAG: UvrD-helicase domain-containing protein [Myxococcales bacterium]